MNATIYYTDGGRIVVPARQVQRVIRQIEKAGHLVLSVFYY